jgi:aspartyl-tRNA(Asn)/glutamyl-tRNA(Gln) amidotransferase subunit A
MQNFLNEAQPMQNIPKMSAAELGRSIAEGRLDPIEITQSYIDVAQRHPETGRIYTILTKERALSEAENASLRAKTGQRLSPLDGVPISWKDLFDTAGHKTEAGSALLRGRVPQTDARCLKNATSVGLVCLGKTHMSELAFSGLGLNPVTETPPCINDPETVPGGSSSGAGASVAFGLAAGAIGSDTGGSVRIPAAWNDLVGLKTTSGKISLEGVVPLCEKFDTVGPLSKTVEDSALLFAALCGEQPIDLKETSLAGTRLAILRADVINDVRDAPSKAFDQSIEGLKKAGAQVEEITLECVSEAMSLTTILFNAEAYGTWKETIEKRPDLMFDKILARFRGGADIKGSDYVAAWQRLEILRVTYQKATQGYDAILCPTSPIVPPNAARLLTDEDYYVTENLLALRNTRVGNLLGLCAVTLPTGVPSCGLMMLAGPYQEKRLLRLAMAAERALS